MATPTTLSRIVVAGWMTGLAAAGCGGGPGGGSQPDASDFPAWGDDHQYVFTEIFLPTTAAQANMYGLNLDLDAEGGPDNALGQILSSLAGQVGSFELQEEMDQRVSRGDVIMLANVKTTSLTTAAGVGTSIYLGINPSTPPCIDATDQVCGRHLEGGTSFELDPVTLAYPLLVGQIVGGELHGGPGDITISLPLVPGGDSLILYLIAARVEVGVITESGMMAGKVGGALTEASIHNEYLPALHAALAEVVATDCASTAAPCCETGSTGEDVVALFDQSDPPDCVVTLEELRTSGLLLSLLAPDVDLFDGEPTAGNFAPGTDGVNDCLSIGVGFSATTAVFSHP